MCVGAPYVNTLAYSISRFTNLEAIYVYKITFALANKARTLASHI